MHLIVENQLRRAATRGRTTLLAPVAVAPVLGKIVDSLKRVYVERNVSCSVTVDNELQFYGEEGDLYELFGNLLDNAFKYGGQRVEVRAAAIANEKANRPGIEISVADDGDGIDSTLRERLVRRGERSDTAEEAEEGQGLGLAVVLDVVESYDGTLEIEDSELGGALIRIRIAQAS